MIRKATQDDVVGIVGLLRDYSKVMDLRDAQSAFSAPKTAGIVSTCVSQQMVWVYDKDGLQGVLVALEQYNTFSTTIKEAQLVALYVKPEFRKGLAGGRLIKTYDDECDNRGLSVSWLGFQHTATLNDKSLKRLGYRLSELQYIKER